MPEIGLPRPGPATRDRCLPDSLRYFDGVASETALYDGTITGIVEQYGASLPAPYVLSFITHRYDYDALYQLIGSESDFWDQATEYPNRQPDLYL